MTYLQPTAKSLFIDAALALAIAACLSMSIQLDAPGDLEVLAATALAVTDAEHQAARDLRRDRAAARLCHDLHGEAVHAYNDAGELVCIPRRGKRVVEKVAAL